MVELRRSLNKCSNGGFRCEQSLNSLLLNDTLLKGWFGRDSSRSLNLR